MTDELLTVDEAARRLKIHPVTLRRLVAEGKVPVIRIGSSLRFREDMVIEHCASGDG